MELSMGRVRRILASALHAAPVQAPDASSDTLANPG
jgi:hypothetical protein